MKKIALLGLLFVLGLTACGSTPAESKSSEQPASSSEITTSSSNVVSSSSEAKSSSSQVQSSSSKVSSSSVHEHLFTPTAPIEPTCTTKGSQTYVCSCGATTTKEIDALGHDYGNMVNGYLPSYYFDGMQDYYKCSRCKQYFDANKKETTESALKLEKASDNVAVSVNGEQKGIFTLLSKDENAVTWEYKNLTVAVNDVISLTKPGDATYKYQYFGAGNIDQDGKVLTAGAVNFNLVATPNGFQLAISGYKYPGLVVKVNDNEYPLNKVNYLEDNKETYIYGYHYFNVGDKMTVVDNVNDIVYHYDDLEYDTQWNVYDFHRGPDNEIVFDTEARFGIEFDRGGDSCISITKTFAPRNASSFQVNFNSSRPAEELKEYSYSANSQEYTELAWYVKNEKVINNEDAINYLDAKGLKVYISSITFEVNEKFDITDLTNNVNISAEHLVSVMGPINDFAVIEGSFIKITKAGTFEVVYVPFCDSIALYSTKTSVTPGYMLQKGNFVPGVFDSNDLVVFNNVTVAKNDYVAFTDNAYLLLNLTLDPNSDSSLVRFSSGLVYLNKGGVFNFKVDISTKVLTIEVVSLEEEQQQTELTSARIVVKGSSSMPLMTVNPDNANELCATGIVITGSADMAYVTFYAADYSGAIEGITLSSDSEQYASAISTLFYMKADGTYDFYLHKTTRVLRIVKQA